MKRIARIWGVGLVIIMLVSLFAALPASAGTLSWSAETLPSTSNVVLVPTAGMDIVDLTVAADGTTMYAAMGTGGGVVGQKLYKSTSAGASWAAVTPPNNLAGDAVNFVAVAPDDANILVIIGDAAGTQKAWVSTNAGSTWSDMGLTATGTYYDLDISVASSGVHYVGVVGTTVAPAATFLYFNLGSAVASWVDAVGGTWTDTPTTIDSYRAVKFSPNFASDKVATLVSQDDTNDIAKFHIAFFATKKWDALAGFTSYPVTVTASTAGGRAQIALDPAYLGADEASRLAYVGVALTGTNGIFRISNTTVKALGSANTINSIAYNGTNLIAGAYDSNIVYRSADPTATSPTVSAATLYKRPGVDAAATDEKVLVAFSGTNAVAGTSGKSSAFAISADNGATFKDISLIDTVITNIEDVWVAADASKRYFLSNDGDVTSLWRYDGSWARVFAIDDTPNGYIIRGAADSADVLYIADTTSTTMYYTKDAGQTKWSLRAAGNNIRDMAVESADVAYIAVDSAKTVSKTTNAGFTWATAKDTSVSDGNLSMIASLGTDKLIVGSTLGYVAYSTDGNASWTKIDKITETLATVVQVTASGLATGDYIYAASDEADTHVVRWQIGTSTAWTDMSAPTDAVPTSITNPQAYGIGLRDGVLYVLVSNGVDSEAWRTLGPTASTPTWSLLTTTGTIATAAPQALKVSAGSVKLWTVNNPAGADSIYSYTDTLATSAPTASSPATGFQNPVNPVTGRSVDVAFSWTKPSDKVTDYTIKLYADAAGTQLVKSVDVASTDSNPVVLIGPFNNTLEYTPGNTYYWKVRVKSPILSPFSAMLSFTIQPGTAQAAQTLSPANGATGTSTTPSFSWAPISQTTKYRFILADNAGLNNPAIDTSIASTAYTVLSALTPGKTYFWAVQAVEPVQGTQSAIANFTVAGPAPTATATAAPPVITVTTVPQPTIIITTQPPATITVNPPVQTTTTPGFIWAIIVIGAILVIAVIVLIVRTRRTV